MSNTFPCQVCGASVKAEALVCPSCGACEKSGLTGDGDANAGLGLPDDAFDYDAFLHEEFGEKRIKSKKDTIIGIVAVVLIIVFALVYLL